MNVSLDETPRAYLQLSTLAEKNFLGISLLNQNTSRLFNSYLSYLHSFLPSSLTLISDPQSKLFLLSKSLLLPLPFLRPVLGLKASQRRELGSTEDAMQRYGDLNDAGLDESK